MKERCVCEPGYTGKDCSLRDMKKMPCKDDCMSNGRCDLGKCICNPGYKGDNCSIEEKESCPTDIYGKMCSDNGICNYNICFCFGGYTVSKDLKIRDQTVPKQGKKDVYMIVVEMGSV